MFEAQRKDDAIITVNGREEHATRVEWGLSGWRRTFYKGSQWYRYGPNCYPRSNVCVTKRKTRG